MFKFKHTRKAVAGLVAVAALAGAFGSGAAAPERADAAQQSCQWQIPYQFIVRLTNGWTVKAYMPTGTPFVWAVNAAPRRGYSMGGELRLTRWDRTGSNPRVRFTVDLDNGSSGVYTGTIDADGYVTGASRDRYNSRSTAGWRFERYVDCR
jgi:hypothetical protein